MAPEAAENRGLAKIRMRSEDHTSELQSQSNLVCRLLLDTNRRQRTAARARTRGRTRPWRNRWNGRPYGGMIRVHAYPSEGPPGRRLPAQHVSGEARCRSD